MRQQETIRDSRPRPAASSRRRGRRLSTLSNRGVVAEDARRHEIGRGHRLSPSITRDTMASRLIAFEIASLTRGSLKGFFASGLPALSVANGRHVASTGPCARTTCATRSAGRRGSARPPATLRDIGRRHVLDRVDIAGQQRRHARGVVTTTCETTIGVPRRLAARRVAPPARRCVSSSTRSPRWNDASR